MNVKREADERTTGTGLSQNRTKCEYTSASTGCFYMENLIRQQCFVIKGLGSRFRTPDSKPAALFVLSVRFDYWLSLT